MNYVIEWLQALGNEGLLMDVRDDLSEEVPLGLRPEWYRKELSLEELKIRRGQVQKPMVEIDFEIFEE